MAEVKNTAKTATPAAPKKSSNLFAVLVVPICLIVAVLIYKFILGNPANFMDAEMHTPKNAFGNMYLGGFVVPVLMGTFLTLLSMVIERFLSISKAKGKVNGTELVRKVQYHLANKNIEAAIAECDKQRGSVGNVLKSGLHKYKEMISNTEMDHEQKILSIKAEVEEATALELPMLEKNLVFLSTIASVATLLGLFGTVLGMIRAFSAMAQAGAPDATALAAGISEALINTALGIGTSAVAIIAYNYFTTNIDGITYAIDESGFTLTQSFAANYK